MQDLFDSVTNLHQDLIRNIVSLRESEDLFDDLSDGEDELSLVAIYAEMRVKEGTPSDVINRGFHYTTAIDYPFNTDPFMQTRYGDGTFGTWYGSLEFETSIFETVHHMAQEIRNIEHVEEVVHRERAVYDVGCRALLLNLVGKETLYPDLVADGYVLTQQIGHRVRKEGHPGILVPSARYKGTNAVIFNREVLSDPRHRCYLTYLFDPIRRLCTVEREAGVPFMEIPA